MDEHTMVTVDSDYIVEVKDALDILLAATTLPAQGEALVVLENAINDLVFWALEQGMS